MSPSMRDLTGLTTAPSQGVEDELRKGKRGDSRRLQERRRERLNEGLVIVCYRCRRECDGSMAESKIGKRSQGRGNGDFGVLTVVVEE